MYNVTILEIFLAPSLNVMVWSAFLLPHQLALHVRNAAVHVVVLSHGAVVIACGGIKYMYMYEGSGHHYDVCCTHPVSWWVGSLCVGLPYMEVV